MVKIRSEEPCEGGRGKSKSKGGSRGQERNGLVYSSDRGDGDRGGVVEGGWCLGGGGDHGGASACRRKMSLECSGCLDWLLD